MTDTCEHCGKDMGRHGELNDHGYCIGCVSDMLQRAYWALHDSLPMAKGWADDYARKYLPTPEHVSTTTKREIHQHHNIHAIALRKVNESLTEIEKMHSPFTIRKTL